MNKEIKITEEQFSFFKQACKKYIVYYGLSDWEIYFSKRSMQEKNAQTSFNPEAKKAAISFVENWTDEYLEPTDETIDRVAHHEIIHVVLAGLSSLINIERNVMEAEATTEEHGIVMRLLNVYYKS